MRARRARSRAAGQARGRKLRRVATYPPIFSSHRNANSLLQSRGVVGWGDQAAECREREIRPRSGIGLRSARCVAKIHSDQSSSCFVGADGIFNSINCDATGSLPIEARSDLVLLCVSNGTFPGMVMCSAFFAIALQSMKAKRLC